MIEKEQGKAGITDTEKVMKEKERRGTGNMPLHV